MTLERNEPQHKRLAKAFYQVRLTGGLVEDSQGSAIIQGISMPFSKSIYGRFGVFKEQTSNSAEFDVVVDGRLGQVEDYF